MIVTEEQFPESEFLWKQILADIRSKLNRQRFETWFRRVTLLGLDESKLRIGVPNVFLRNWLQDYYLETLKESVEQVLSQALLIEIEVIDAPETESSTTGSSSDTSVHGESRSAAPAPSASPGPGTSPSPSPSSSPTLPLTVERGRQPDFHLNDQYKFENFVVGPGNRLAHAAALAVSESPATVYNPLFMHGSVGLGKTHLLQAICHTLLERNPNTRILYLSCEEFINHFISAVENGDLDAFRNRYRHGDIILVDDIHFLANKERTQEEFFHTFNTLYNAKKQIVLSSDSPPKEIPSLQDRLVSRFKWGMVAEIEPPDYETRMAIIKKKAKARGRDLPDDVAQFLAENFSQNIREIEGAVLKTVGYASLNGSPITLSLAREAMKDVIAPSANAVTFDAILQMVAEDHDLKISDLLARRRTKQIAFARQLAMYLARKLTGHSYEEIGGYIGGRDHTTVLYAYEKVQKLLETDDNVRVVVDRFVNRLRNGSS